MSRDESAGLPRISIVTPSYGQRRYLESTIRAVLDQNYPNLEYVVIDAGSTDGSVDLIRSVADRLHYWVSEPDRGHADGIAKGFRHTTGEIMAWINSSDIYFPWTLETVASIFRDVPEAEWIIGVPTRIAEGTAPKEISSGLWNRLDFLSGRCSFLQQESVFWRRTLWERAGASLDLEYKLACDFELWLRFFEHAPLYHVQTILAGFRYHDEQRGRSAAADYAAETRRALSRFRESATTLDRFRSHLVRAARMTPDQVLRRGLRRTPLWQWDAAPKIYWDFERRKWRTR